MVIASIIPLTSYLVSLATTHHLLAQIHSEKHSQQDTSKFIHYRDDFIIEPSKLNENGSFGGILLDYY